MGYIAKTTPLILSFLSLGISCNAFSTLQATTKRAITKDAVAYKQQQDLKSKSFSTSLGSSATSNDGTGTRICRASELLKTLIEEDKCYTTVAGAKTFADYCDINVVYEDCYEPQPIVGKIALKDHLVSKVDQRKGKGEFRLDRISDGDKACGFAWTWTCDGQEGLRGTTFIELNESGEIQYVREIPEPIFKPGDLTLELLKAVTKGAKPKIPEKFEVRTPTTASEIVKYLFLEVQGSDVSESMKLFDEKIVYRDFNYEQLLNGKAEVQKFIEDFSFPGITFKPQRFDDGITSTCLTWEVILDLPSDDGDDPPPAQPIKGISFYEIDPITKKVIYVRDVPESAIKPPILGKFARQLRPGLGVFTGVPIGSRPGGM